MHRESYPLGLAPFVILLEDASKSIPKGAMEIAAIQINTETGMRLYVTPITTTMDTSQR
jgi:hypothetical protein